jgi:hypothetical protein
MKPLICYPKGQNSGICNTELYNYAQYLDVLSYAAGSSPEPGTFFRSFPFLE